MLPVEPSPELPADCGTAPSLIRPMLQDLISGAKTLLANETTSESLDSQLRDPPEPSPPLQFTRYGGFTFVERIGPGIFPIRGRDKSSDLELIRGPTVLYTSHRIGNIPGPILSTKVNPPYRVNWSGGLGSGGSLSCESSDSLVVSLASNVFAPDIKSCNIGRISEGAVPQSAGSSGEGSTGSIDEQP
jgi:hypothetical protein